MATPDWHLFGAAVALLTTALLVLSRASARVISDSTAPEAGVPETAKSPTGHEDESTAPPLPTGVALLANVALTHGLVLVVLAALAWYAGIPPASLGIGTLSSRTVAVGLGLGVGLYLASETATAVADREGIEYDERLGELLAPENLPEWALLLLVILPLVAGAEELLFRGVLVGAIGVGFGLPPWPLVVGSSVLFGLGHSAQGGVGVVVTASLGLVLGAAFVSTGSLLVVVVAHHVVDALEFVVREGVLGS